MGDPKEEFNELDSLKVTREIPEIFILFVKNLKLEEDSETLQTSIGEFLEAKDPSKRRRKPQRPKGDKKAADELLYDKKASNKRQHNQSNKQVKDKSNQNDKAEQ